MNKKFIIVIILSIIIVLVILIILNKYKKEKTNIMVETKSDYEEQIGEYKIVYNELNFMYELYDEYGNLIITTPDKESCKFFVENPRLEIEENYMDQ